jgi:hypothetical protein
MTTTYILIVVSILQGTGYNSSTGKSVQFQEFSSLEKCSKVALYIDNQEWLQAFCTAK